MNGVSELAKLSVPVVDTSGFDEGEVAASLREIARLASELEAVRLAVVAVVAGRHDVAAMVNRVTGCGEREARDVARKASVVADTPELVDMLYRRAVVVGHVRTLTKVGDANDVRSLLDAAVAQSVDDFADTVKRFIVDRDSAIVGSREMAERTLKFIERRDGMVGIAGVLPRTDGIEFRNRLIQIMNDQWVEKHPQRASQLGGHDQPGERPDQRMVDALISLGRGQVNPSGRPAVIVTIDAETLEAELIGHGPIPTEAAAAVMTRANVYAEIRGTKGVRLNFGQARRLATPMQRLVIAARDKHCQYKGCKRPYLYSEVHHTTEFRHGGATDLDHLVLLCREHHHHLHNHGMTIRRISGHIIIYDRHGVPIGIGPPLAPENVAA